MATQNTINEVVVTKNVRGFELSADLAKSAEKLITAVAKSETGVREIAKTLYEVQENKLLTDDFKGIGDFFEAMTGLSKSSASQYLRTFKAFKNEDNNKFCKLSALVPFSMLTEMAKLYGIVKKTIVIDEDGDKGHAKVETGNVPEVGDKLLEAFVNIVLPYEDFDCFRESDTSDREELNKEVLAYVAKNWTNKQVREVIEASDVVTEFEKNKEKKGKKKDGNGNGNGNDNENTVDYDAVLEAIAKYRNDKKMTKKAFFELIDGIVG